MEFEYFTDEIVLNSETLNNEIEVAALDNLMIPVTSSLEKIEIKSQQLTTFYKRNKKGASVLGIQLLDGNNEDISNYLVYDCLPNVSGKSVFCNIDMHAYAKLSSKAMQFANLVSNDITNFFNQMEQSIIENGYDGIELDYMKNIFFQRKKKNVFSKILRRFKNNESFWSNN